MDVLDNIKYAYTKTPEYIFRSEQDEMWKHTFISSKILQLQYFKKCS